MQDESITFIIIFAALWALWHFDVDPLGDEISVYRQHYKCSDNAKKTDCEWVNGNHTIHSVNANSQTVTYWTEKNPWPLYALNNCKVVNKNRWSCDDPIYTSQYGFNDGEFSKKNNETFRYVSKSTWWLNKL